MSEPIPVHGTIIASDVPGAKVSPAVLVGLLNHQLYESTPDAKYATLFLGIYDAATRRITYCNGGHLPPILLSEDGSTQLLDCGGSVVGLLDNLHFREATVQLRTAICSSPIATASPNPKAITANSAKTASSRSFARTAISP